MASLVEAIQLAESFSTGEIRIHIDQHSDQNFAREALDTFHRLGMDKTQDRNGVLFYINFRHKYLTILGDKGIHERVKQSFWDQLHDEITQGFAKHEFCASLKAAVLKTGKELKTYFPTHGENKNELPNEISFSS